MTADSPFRRRALTGLGLAAAALVWASVAWAGDRRDIVFDCPCSAEWVAGEPDEPGILTVRGGIRSFRAVDSGELTLSQDWWGSEGSAILGPLPARSLGRDAWSIAYTEPEPGEAIEVQLLEETGRRPDGWPRWAHHETLALWPVDGEGSGTRQYVDILTDADGDGVGDVNERLAGTSWEDPQSTPGLSQVDVLLLYTEKFARREESYPYTHLLHVMAAASAFFEDSATNIRLNVVGMQEVEIGENGWAVPDQRRDLMESHGADLSVQFSVWPHEVPCNAGGCAEVGAAWSALWSDAQAYDGGRNSVVYTAHEIGHAMGLAHSALQGETYGAWLWSRGHYFTPRYRGSFSRRGTIMSYGPPVDGVFSSPAAFCGAGPCGVPATESDGADAVSTLDLLRFQIASHRPAAIDTDGDGFVDASDAAPDDPDDWFDIDGDGIADNADPDDDNDGTPDRDDAFPLDPDEWADADLDGIGDNADEEVTDHAPFRDPALRAAVERELGKQRGATITPDDIATLTSLWATGAGIRDLTGLEQATSLGELGLHHNEVVDLTPLSGLGSLARLHMGWNGIRDVSPLGNLPSLRVLVLSNNPIGDLRPLSGASGLVSLEIDYAPVAFSDVRALPFFRNLNGLGVAGLGIGDLSVLAGLPLRRLNVSDNPLSDLSPLAEFKSLYHLEASNTGVTDIGPLRALGSLATLQLNGNSISDVEPLSDLGRLTSLALGGNGIEDIEPLRGLDDLRSLNLGENRIADVSPLSEMKQLQYLWLWDNPIRNVEPLQGLVDLRGLNLTDSPLEDVSPLSAMTRLETLTLRDNGIKNIEPLRDMVNLTFLDLGGNRIKNIEPLRDMVNLTFLDLGGNRIENVDAVSRMARLRFLALYGNAVEDIRPLEGLANVTELHLYDNRISDVSPLSSLRGVGWMLLQQNAITDIAPLMDRAIFADWASVPLTGNPLNEKSVEEHIPTLRSWGFAVAFEAPHPASVVDDPTLRDLIVHRLASGSGHVDDELSAFDFGNLHSLELAGRGVTSLAGVEAATGLVWLFAAANRIADLSPLAELPELWGLDLRDNRIVDVSPLVANTGLVEGAWVSLDGNPLSEESLNTHIPALLERGVDVGVARIGLTVLAAGDGLRYDVSGYFEAVLGGDVTFSVSVEDAGAADAEIADGALIVTPGDRPGGTTVTLTGENVLGETETLTFAVTVRGPWMAPMVPNGMDAVRQGFVRVVNHGREGAEARIVAVDDAGDRRDGSTLAVGPGGAVHFNSSDLEAGNADKGLAGGSGRGSGDWRLEVESVSDLTVLSYVRNVDGFLTPMRSVLPTAPGVWDVPIFNPASNVDQASSLRIANLGDERAEVVITGVDDHGRSPGSAVRIEIAGGATRTLTAPELEDGPAAGRGGLGDGSGKWRLRIKSDGALAVTNLLQSPEGHLTDLSTVPDPLPSEADVHTVPLFPAASDEKGRQGFVRIINRTGRDGEVDIAAYDDAGRRYEPLKLLLKAGQTVHFNSDDLELGNEAKGLTGSTGSGSGDWRLEMRSELEIDVLAYLRTPGGFLTAIHDVVPWSGRRYAVATFNPGSNTDQVSRLRIVNAGSRPAHVSIAGIDDGGKPGEEIVRLSVAAGASRTLTSAELERGGWEQRGRLGDGRGKWRLQVDCEQPILLMNLLDSPTGHMTNLSVALVASPGS